MSDELTKLPNDEKKSVHEGASLPRLESSSDVKGGSNESLGGSPPEASPFDYSNGEREKDQVPTPDNDPAKRNFPKVALPSIEGKDGIVREIEAGGAIKVTQVNVGPVEKDDHSEMGLAILSKIQTVIDLYSVKKVYFIDDAINQDTGKAAFKALVATIITEGKYQELIDLDIKGIDFSVGEEVVLDVIEQSWDSLKHAKQLRYFEKAHRIAGSPEAINDLNVSNNLKDFFMNEQIQFLTPTDWDARQEEILAEISDDERVLIFFDQDLKLAGGRFADRTIKGENLILELMERGLGNKLIVSLLTHTINNCSEELPERTRICSQYNQLKISQFFVLAKFRLENPEMFADGIKKVCLNVFCENIKDDTLKVLNEAYSNAVKQIEGLDTYDFDHSILRTSSAEGVWEPDTLVRVFEVVFRDEVRKLMIDKNYIEQVNPIIVNANEVSSVEFNIDKGVNPYINRFRIRHQELFENEEALNKLRRPIDNGDIFVVTDGQKAKKLFILVAQECDLMVRGDNGHRGASSTTLLEIELLSEKQLLAAIERKHKSDIEKRRFNTHYFLDKYKLEYWDPNSDRVGIVHFGKSHVVDLSVLDLLIFNSSGEVTLDLGQDSYNEKFHNKAWRKRNALLIEGFSRKRGLLDTRYQALSVVQEAETRNEIEVSVNEVFSFIEQLGVVKNYSAGKFTFGIKRVRRLRFPQSKYLLDKYYQYMSRPAEPHDFAD